MKRSQTALEWALTLLGRKDFSVRELRTALEKRGFAEEEITEALKRIRNWGYLDDRDFTRRRIEKFLREGKSRSYIKYRLESYEIPLSIISEELNRLYPPEKEREVLSSWWEKLRSQVRGRPAVKEKTKWARKMLTAGFAPEDVQACYEQEEEQEEDS